MARLRSSRVPPGPIQSTGEPSQHADQDEDLKASVNEKDDLTKSAGSTEMQHEAESSKQEYSAPRYMKTPAPGLLKRTISTLSWAFGSPQRPSLTQSGFLNQTSTLTDENTSEQPTTALVPNLDGEGKILVEVDGEKLVQLSDIPVGEEQSAEALITTAGEGQQQDLEIVQFEDDETSSRPVEERPVSEEVPHPPNPMLVKTRKSKPRVFNDNSFQYSRPEKDPYDFPSSSSETETPPKPSQADKKKSTKVTKKNDTDRNVDGTKGNKITAIKDVVSPKRRGRPPKDARQNKTDGVSIGAKKLPSPRDPEEGPSSRPEGTNLEINTGKPLPKTKSRGRPKATTRDQTERTVGIEAELKEYIDEHDLPQLMTPKPKAATRSKKRTNAHLQAPEKASKRAKTTGSTSKSNESFSDDDDKTSSRSQSQASPKKRSLTLEVATAEELARQRRKEVKVKERELKIAIRQAEDAERAAERWRRRLDRAREQAVAREREEQGLPPLETRRHIINLSSEDEDFQNGVERVGGVFGTNNLSHATSVPFSQEEREQLVQGLWDERDAGDERYYKIFNFPVFRRANRSYDEIFAKIVDFKHDMMFDWERNHLEDPDIKPLEKWIMSIPDK